MERQRIDSLDGLRGIAALWVLVGHAMGLTGWGVPVIDRPALGVDLFIILSGFLMAYHYGEMRKGAAAFWAKRFFRIAPLYYVCLAAALILGPELYADRMAIDAMRGASPQASSRYLDASPTNIAMHVSFLFGIFPSHAFRTPLPDWSIGLEMQFYAIFPLLVLAAKKWGWLCVILTAFLIGWSAVMGLRLSGMEFPMPSFLPLKIGLFLVGVLCAISADASRERKIAYLLLAVLLSQFPSAPNGTDQLIRLIIILAFFALIYSRKGGFLDSRIMRGLGEISYGCYLIHLLLLIPAIAYWAEYFEGWQLFAVSLASAGAATLALSWIAYRFIELPGIAIGGRIIALMQARRTGAKPLSWRAGKS
ncbi:acyltransferase family protein [Qipengyuania sphaerica]|uniref:acyltransferase family protein n=1 Tax=Qipengyuania sphaerica TaxID=2867243 RepID=UPI001C86DD7F|nr:acyltransferase [Qipengyuania sphaerica]MBX7541272.1 acyltransferase [Qipengyuania sphaerica]